MMWYVSMCERVCVCVCVSVWLSHTLQFNRQIGFLFSNWILHVFCIYFFTRLHLIFRSIFVALLELIELVVF